jgi:hypothetical protein
MKATPTDGNDRPQISPSGSAPNIMLSNAEVCITLNDGGYLQITLDTLFFQCQEHHLEELLTYSTSQKFGNTDSLMVFKMYL